MKFIIFFICVPLVYSELHTFITTYTEISGQTAAGTPEFSAVTTLDDQQMDYYDSIIMKLIPRKDWMEEFASKDMWREDTKIRKRVQQIYKNNIHDVMQRFSQSHGVHTFQRMYGCVWDDETTKSKGFDQYAYDGEDFISLDLKELRYNTSVEQAILTVMKWNNDRTQLDYLKQYYDYECVYWLKEFLHFFNATLKKTEPPKVYLIQKNPDSPVKCHVTGFLFRNTTILWRKNGQAMSDSNKLEKPGETLPNGDGTFQRTVTLYVPPYEWKEHQYTCVVEHKSLTETIQTILTEDEIKRNSKLKPEPGSDASSIMIYLVFVIIPVSVVLIVSSWKCRKLFNSCYKKVLNYISKVKYSRTSSEACGV